MFKHSTYESCSISKVPEDIKINLEVITTLNVHWNVTFETSYPNILIDVFSRKWAFTFATIYEHLFPLLHYCGIYDLPSVAWATQANVNLTWQGQPYWVGGYQCFGVIDSPIQSFYSDDGGRISFETMELHSPYDHNLSFFTLKPQISCRKFPFECPASDICRSFLVQLFIYFCTSFLLS